MLFYIDYLDHITSGAVSVKMLALRLRYDLLIFADDTMCMSVPSCVKLKETTDLLMDLDDFWSAGKICLQLDKKHRKDPMRYFANRKKVLEKGMPEEMLVRHFEYVAYESSRVGEFFNLYIPEVVKNPKRTLYIGKEHDTDLLFRTASAKIFSTHCDTVCSILDTKRAIKFAGIANQVQTYAFDKSLLFQRGVIEDAINDEYRPQKNEKAIVATLLDRAFALANAQTSKATPLSLVTNQLTGRWLIPHKHLHRVTKLVPAGASGCVEMDLFQFRNQIQILIQLRFRKDEAGKLITIRIIRVIIGHIDAYVLRQKHKG